MSVTAFGLTESSSKREYVVRKAPDIYFLLLSQGKFADPRSRSPIRGTLNTLGGYTTELTRAPASAWDRAGFVTAAHLRVIMLGLALMSPLENCTCVFTVSKELLGSTWTPNHPCPNSVAKDFSLMIFA